MESLTLAIAGLGLPVRRNLRQPRARYSAAIGLVGVAAEQALSAILVQTLGPDILLKTATRYKTGREILAEVRGVFRDPVPTASFLTSGVVEAEAHRLELLAKTSGFVILISERAAGLHAGVGPSWEVASIAARKVSDFLENLAKSQRLKPYLEDIPHPPQKVVLPQVLIDDLAAQLRTSRNPQDRAALIKTLFLILPEVPETSPEWIDAFERVAVMPTEGDLSLLLTALESAVPVQLQRASARGSGLSVVVRPDDPNAIPIASHHLRRSFTQITDQWSADVGNANGRLESGSLDLPPEDFVLDLFVLGSQEIKRLLSRDALTAHDVWPFIVSSLRRLGTPGPYWFLVRMTEDLGQLKAQVSRAMRLAHGKNTAKRHAEFIEGIDALQAGSSLVASSNLLEETKEQLAQATKKREGLAEATNRNKSTDRQLPAEAAALVARVSHGELSIGDIIDDVLDAQMTGNSNAYWARILAEAATEPEDRKALVGLLNNKNVSQSHTAAKKAIRLIDTITSGPAMEIEDA